MISKKLLIVIFVPFFLVSCSSVSVITNNGANKNKLSDLYGKYSVDEKFEIHAGALTGQKGNAKYIITVLPGEKENELIVENFANAYKLAAVIKADSIFIPAQKFPYLKDRVTILGKGKLISDTLFYNYFSGGPAGQIDCECKAVKK